MNPKTYNQLSRIILLLILVVIIVIVMYFNKKHNMIEKFSNNISIDSVYEKTINDVYRNLLGRNSHAFEVEKLKQVMKSERDETKVIEVVKQTEEFIEKSKLDDAIKKAKGTSDTESVLKSLETVKLKERMDIFRIVIDLYNEILDRMPDTQELNYYSFRLTNTEDFDKGKLQTILYNSGERKMIEKNQTNVVNADAYSRLTTAELNLKISTLYKEVLKTEDEPPEVTRNFLKSKYIEYDMNDQKISDLIKLLQKYDDVDLESNEFLKCSIEDDISKINNNNSNNSNNVDSSIIDSGGMIDTNSTNNTIDINNTIDTINTNSTNTNKNNNTNQKNNTNKNNKNNKNNNKKVDDIQKLKSEIAKISSELENIGEECDNIGEDDINNDNTGNGKRAVYLDDVDDRTCSRRETKDAFYDNLKKVQKTTDYMYDYKLDRDVSKIQGRTNCKKYLNAYDDMVLFPEYKWSVPEKRQPVCYFEQSRVNPSLDQTALIGTLLEEADNTKVGSIMPKFEYKEMIDY